MRLITKTKTHYVLDAADRKAIRTQLRNLKMTMAGLSKRLGLAPSYLSEVINGKRYYTARLEKLLAGQGIVLEKRRGEESAN